MKTLRYIFGGCPSTLDDCLDHARKTHSGVVELDLLAADLVSEFDYVIQLIGGFIWSFTNYRVRCEHVCGFFRAGDANQLKSGFLRSANRRGGTCLAKIRGTGATIVVEKSRFGPSSLKPPYGNAAIAVNEEAEPRTQDYIQGPRGP
jgi:hypothetical protein